MPTRILLYFSLLCISFSASAQDYGVKMADSIMERNPNTYRSWDYETGTVLRGFELLYKASGDEKYLNYIRASVESQVSANGVISGYSMSDYNVDEVKEGSLVLYLYELTGDERYRAAAASLMQQLDRQPQTSEGGNWHKNKYPDQMWLDGLYMAQPFNAHYGALFDRPDNIDDVVLQLRLMEDHARDPQTGLLYHGWDESRNASWANAQGQSPEFWGRSLGWYAMALVDVLDYIPDSYSAQRTEIVAILQRLAEAMVKVQDPSTGVWWQVPDKAGQSGNWIESSVTAMMSYSLAKAARLGYIDASYADSAKKAWNGLVSEFVTQDWNGTLSLTATCEGTGVGSSYSFYIGRARRSNDPKGLGPFLMAAAEIEFQGSPSPKPRLSSAIADKDFSQGDAQLLIDLNTVFTDPDSDTLYFSHSASELNDTNVSLQGAFLTIDPQVVGSVTHTITADDQQDGSVSDSFVVTVHSENLFSVEIQAESANWSSGTVDRNHAGYTGTGFVNTANATGEWLSFVASVPAAGEYNLLVRYANGASAERSMSAEVNGLQQISSVAFPVTGSWSNWGEQSLTVLLAQGENTIRLVSLVYSGAANIDKYVVSTEEVSPTQEPDPELSVVLNASVNDGAVSLSWSYTDFDALEQDIYRGPSASSAERQLIASGVSGDTYVDRGLSEGSYYYWLGAADAEPNRIESSAVRAVVESLPPTPTPGPEPVVTLQGGVSGSDASLAWSYQNFSAASQGLYRDTDAEPSGRVLIASDINGASYTDSGLEDGDYYYWLRATDPEGNTLESDVVGVTVDAGPTPEPSASCDYAVQNQWGSGFVGEITISNNSDTPIYGWTIRWAYATNSRVSTMWSAELSGTNPYTASNLSWNATIEPGQSVSLGFQGRKPRGAAAEIPEITGDVCQ